MAELSNTPFIHYVYISIRTSVTTAILINRNCIRKTYTRYVHSRKIYNILVRALETDKSARLWRAFLAWNMRVRINFIFTENVRIFCLSYNVKNSKTTAKLSENCWNKCRSIYSLSMVSSGKFTLILLPFLTGAQHESGTRKALLGTYKIMTRYS